MIRFIKVEELLHVRNEVLREGRLTLDECRFPSDNEPGNFHLGYFINEELACIASFHPQPYGELIGVGYQLRGMATTEKYRDKASVISLLILL
ncbi:hypothetical protein AAFN85_10560 [Mucilaginibacter sp. CAU 1740]|uniref:hypothetical protein n=1 Tax=Mucilaginibacter sp. CAU 1740 TaxID=3140365 RepID=UPI00325B606C